MSTATQAKPQLYLCGASAALYWRAVREGRLPPPEPCSITHVAQPVVSLRQLQRIDLTPLGLQIGQRCVMATYQHASLVAGESTQWKCPQPVSMSAQDARPTYVQELLPGTVVRTFWPRGLALMPGQTHQLELLVATKSQLRTRGGLDLHLLEGCVPEGSFYRVSRDIVVTSPELTFVQVCRLNRMLPNVELLMEWCGTYLLVPNWFATRTEATPLLCRERLEAYLQQIAGMRGVAAARAALRLASEGPSASPRETELYLALALPPRLGGYGFAKPQVNAVIPLDGNGAGVLDDAEFYRADLLFEGKGGRHVVVEYDGRDGHEASAEEVRHDKERRSVLAALGYLVIVATRRDVASVGALRRKVTQIARALGVEVREFSQVEARAHEALVTWLFNAEHAHLPFGAGY